MLWFVRRYLLSSKCFYLSSPRSWALNSRQHCGSDCIPCRDLWSFVVTEFSFFVTGFCRSMQCFSRPIFIITTSFFFPSAYLLCRDRPFFGFLTVMSRHHKFCRDKIYVQLLQVGVATWNFMSLQHFCFGSCCSSNYVSQHKTPCCHCLLQFPVATHFSCHDIEKSVSSLLTLFITCHDLVYLS